MAACRRTPFISSWQPVKVWLTVPGDLGTLVAREHRQGHQKGTRPEATFQKRNSGAGDSGRQWAEPAGGRGSSLPTLEVCPQISIKP